MRASCFDDAHLTRDVNRVSVNKVNNITETRSTSTAEKLITSENIDEIPTVTLAIQTRQRPVTRTETRLAHETSSVTSDAPITRG